MEHTKPIGEPPEWLLAYGYYGVSFCPVGDDGDALVAAGHPDTRRVIAAFNRYARVDLGLDSLYDDRTADAAGVAEELLRTWAVVSTECGQCDGEADCSTCLAARRDDGWIFWGRKETDEGAFPVTVLRRG